MKFAEPYDWIKCDMKNQLVFMCWSVRVRRVYLIFPVLFFCYHFSGFLLFLLDW